MTILDLTDIARAVYNNDIDKLMKLVIDERTGVQKMDMENENGYRLCQMAIRNKNYAILNVLINHFSLNKLIASICENDDVELLNSCIIFNATFSEIIRTKCCYHALRRCAKFNSVNVFGYYIKNRIHTNTENDEPILHMACYNTNVKLVKLLCKQLTTMEINECNAKQQNAFHIAVLEQDLKIIKLLINASIDVNLVDATGATGFSYACSIQSDAIVAYLLSVKNRLQLFIDENHKDIFAYKSEHPTIFSTKKLKTNKKQKPKKTKKLSIKN